MPDFAIIGYGKMGKEIEKYLLELGYHISVIIDNEDDWKNNEQKLSSCDVALEFSMPSIAISNFSRCIERKLPFVTGTTGWYNQLDKVIEMCSSNSCSMVYASNYSIGVNLFYALNNYAASLMNNYPQYEVKIEETHHIHKKDAPSGTAITLAQNIIDIMDNKNSWQLGNSDDSHVLPIFSHREGEVPGIHEVCYKSENDVIKLSHSALSRRMLAEGAVKAALWLFKNPGVYDFSKIFNLV